MFRSNPAVLMVIDIPVIKELAFTTSLGVTILVFTKLLLVPVLLSYVGVSPAAARRSLREDSDEQKGKGIGAIWNLLDRFTQRRWASAAVVSAALIGGAAFAVSLHLQIGDRHIWRHHRDPPDVAIALQRLPGRIRPHRDLDAGACLDPLAQPLAAVESIPEGLRRHPHHQVIRLAGHYPVDRRHRILDYALLGRCDCCSACGGRRRPDDLETHLSPIARGQ